jgi:hypothetical protein
MRLPPRRTTSRTGLPSCQVVQCKPCTQVGKRLGLWIGQPWRPTGDRGLLCTSVPGDMSRLFRATLKPRSRTAGVDSYTSLSIAVSRTSSVAYMALPSSRRVAQHVQQHLVELPVHPGLLANLPSRENKALERNKKKRPNLGEGGPLGRSRKTSSKHMPHVPSRGRRSCARWRPARPCRGRQRSRSGTCSPGRSTPGPVRVRSNRPQLLLEVLALERIVPTRWWWT